jgi:ABC-type molybdate transport system ATPase subunit
MPVVWVTHDFEQAERLADEVVVLWAGHVASDEERRRFLAGDTGDQDRDVDSAGGGS